MIFSRRGPRESDPHLEGKVWVFLMGSMLALVGIAMDSSLLVGAAILVLCMGVFLRFFSGFFQEKDEVESSEGLYENGEAPD